MSARGSSKKGAHGVVVIEEHDGKDVAVKTCPRTKDALQECSILTQLQGHPNIIKLLKVDLAESSIKMTMEWVPRTLLSLIQNPKNKGGISSHQLYGRLSMQLIDVMQFIHSQSFIHKDIKLENILVADGQIRLIDFGFSRPYSKGREDVVSREGSLHYAAPEIWHREPHEGPEADIWALGVVLYLMATGFFPFGGDSPDEIYSNIMEPLWVPPALASQPTLLALIRGMLTVKRTERLKMDDIMQHPWVLARKFGPILRKTASEDSVDATGRHTQRAASSRSYTDAPVAPTNPPSSHRGDKSPRVHISRNIQPRSPPGTAGAASSSTSGDTPQKISVFKRLKGFFVRKS